MVKQSNGEDLNHAELRRERDTLRELFEQTPSFMAMLEGPQHRYILSNAANQALLGERCVIGKTVAEALPELVQQGFTEILDRVYSTGEAFFGKGLPFEVPGALRSEPWRRYVDFIYQPIRNSAGVVTGIFIEGHDVTEQYVAHERISALQGELINLSRASSMGTMASTLAHELNQPLAAITNYVSAASRIAERTGADPMLVECLLSAQEAAVRAGDAIRALREMSESGRVHSEVVAIEAVTREAAQLACAAHPKLAVTVTAPAGATAKVDRIQFQHVLLNLLRNSSEAARGRACRIDLDISLMDGEAILSVSDNGTGIPEEVLPRIFDAFFTTKVRGMGVGLAICRTIIEANGGRISAHNNEGGGATICLVLPQA